MFYNSVVQPCRPFTTCGDRSFKCGDRQVFRSESLMINTLHFPLFLTKVVTARHMTPQLWRMWRQREYGWTPLFYNIKLTWQMFIDLRIWKRKNRPWIGEVLQGSGDDNPQNRRVNTSGLNQLQMENLFLNWL